MFKAPLFAIALLLVIRVQTRGQVHSNCVDALLMCGNDSINFPLDDSPDARQEHYELCTDNEMWNEHFFEQASVWLKYQFTTDGDFSFIITPQYWDEDLDFVLFKSSTTNCEELIPIRCMFSGETVGGEIDTICLGATGLSDTSFDTFEAPGCDNMSDNFLAPVQITEGDILFVVISAFSGPTNIKIEHTGSAEIYCEPVNLDLEQESKIRIYPNPVEQVIHLKYFGNEVPQFEFEIMNATGQIIRVSDFSKMTEIDLSDQPKGFYIIRLYATQITWFTMTTKIIKVN